MNSLLQDIFHTWAFFVVVVNIAARFEGGVNIISNSTLGFTSGSCVFSSTNSSVVFRIYLSRLLTVCSNFNITYTICTRQFSSHYFVFSQWTVLLSYFNVYIARAQVLNIYITYPHMFIPLYSYQIDSYLYYTFLFGVLHYCTRIFRSYVITIKRGDKNPLRHGVMPFTLSRGIA
jgi:hypothetical protein